MADGQVVLVTTESLGGGSPVRSVYFVAEQDPEKAKAIIGAMMAPNEKVEAWGRLPEAAVSSRIETWRLQARLTSIERDSETAQTEPDCRQRRTQDIRSET